MVPAFFERILRDGVEQQRAIWELFVVGNLKIVCYNDGKKTT